MASKTVTHHSLDTWAQFVAGNCIGTYGLMWSCGITFMLSMTISVLQLREVSTAQQLRELVARRPVDSVVCQVLHPAFCARLIRPQEAHNELISSLVQDSGLVHARRVMVSLLVYMGLMLLFLFVPLQTLSWLHSWALPLAAEPLFSAKVFYLVPQLQLPLELLVCHITFLSVLDKKKDVIGRLQFRWIEGLCALLGLTRFLLPCPMIKKTVRRLNECVSFA